MSLFMKKFLQSTVSRPFLVAGFFMSLLFFASRSNGQVAITGTYTTQNFDAVGSSATAALPSGFKMVMPVLHGQLLPLQLHRQWVLQAQV
jgi:hypothetical protein